MSVEYVPYNLSEVVQIIGGGTPKRKVAEYWGGNIPWLSVVDFNNSQRFVSSSLEHITQKGLEKSSTKLLQASQIIISARGTVGCIAQLEKPMAFNQSCYGLDAKQSVLINDYLYYLLKQKVVELKQVAHGAVFDTITRSTFDNIQVLLPPVETQKKIAQILGDLDKKIQVNHQINQTLEQIAQALFKSWFVDFDPVKAKMEILEAGGSEEEALLAAMQVISSKNAEELAAFGVEKPEEYAELRATAELFPAAMVESELGEIPEGWEVRAFKELCNKVESGGTPRRSESEYWGGEIKWLSSGEVREVVVLDTKEKITTSGLENSSAKLWPVYTTVVAMYGATAGQVCLLANEMTANQACCALVPKDNCKAFVFIAARRSIVNLADKASGSAQQNLNKGIVENHNVITPSENVLAAYELLALPLLLKWIENIQESSALSQLRDTLLPKLLSGELDVSELADCLEADA